MSGDNNIGCSPTTSYEEREYIDEKAKILTRRFRGERPHSLCGTCRYAHIMRLASKNDYIINCQELGCRVPMNITECNKYQNESKLSIMELAKIAKVINDKGEQSGFFF